MKDFDITDLDLLQKEADSSGLAKTMGFELIEIGQGHATAQMRLDDRHLNFYENPHGAALYALADHICSIAGNSVDRRAVMSQSNAYFLASPKPGSLITAYGRLAIEGRSLGVVEVEVVDEENKPLVRFSANVYFIDKEPINCK